MRLGNMLVYPVGSTKACRFASIFLQKANVELVDHPTPEITHLLLDVPSFGPDGTLRGGGDLRRILDMLPGNITVIGGGLLNPMLKDYRILDLLLDHQYLANNAAITAECALQVAAPLLETTLAETPVLILGWGRIGKCLGQLLKAVGAHVTIAARKETDRAMIQALGYDAAAIQDIPTRLAKCRLLFNTVPETILHKDILPPGRKCVLIDLASKPGIEGESVTWARGLPGIHAPESSGKLIAQTILRLCKEETP